MSDLCGGHTRFMSKETLATKYFTSAVESTGSWHTFWHRDLFLPSGWQAFLVYSNVILIKCNRLSHDVVTFKSLKWLRSRRINCVLRVFIRNCNTLNLYDSKLGSGWSVHNCWDWGILNELWPQKSAVLRISYCCVSWLRATKLLEFIFRHPFWCCWGVDQWPIANLLLYMK